MKEENAETEFEPLIIAFLCNWCSYAGADFAGVSRYQYPTSIRIIKVMCSGRVDPSLIFEAFRQGADGVLVAGCHPGDCHYIAGNLEAQQKMKYVERIIKKSKIPLQRFKHKWISASEGKLFAETVAEFTEELKKLGPISKEVIDGVPTMDKIIAAQDEFLDFTVRWMIGKERVLAEEGNVYGEKLPPDRLEKIVGEVVDTKYLKFLILRLIKDAPLSVADISEKLEVDPREIFDCLIQLKNEGAVNIVGFKEDYPVFQGMG
jgi:F420-non-reducing hydrogenase iron-sulfur subunit